MSKDNSSLGRWSWIRFRQKQNTIVRIISSYQCGLGTESSVVFSQQRRYFDQKDNDRHLREIFIEDIYREINH